MKEKNWLRSDAVIGAKIGGVSRLARTLRPCGPCERSASDCSSTLRGDDQPLARQRFVLFFDQITLALSDFVTLSRVGSEFVGAVIAPPALGKESIHGTSPENLGPWSLV